MDNRDIIIKDFKQDHRMILILLQKCKDNRFEKADRVSFLRSARAILMNHLAKEDEMLYPALKDSETAKEFATGMQSISTIITAFFSEQEKLGGFDNTLYDSDFPKIKSLLDIRIKKEESLLYPAFLQKGV